MQCDVHLSRRASRDDAPYLLDVQADLLEDLETRVVVPLIRADHFGRRARGLHPAFDIAGQTFVMATHMLGAVRRSDLGDVVASLQEHRATVVAAIDVLLAGV